MVSARMRWNSFCAAVMLFDQRLLARIDALVFGFLRGLPEEQIGRDRGAEDRDDGGEIIRAPGDLRNQHAGERLAPRHMGKDKRRDIGEQAERQPFQDRDVALVVEKDLRHDRYHAEEHDVDDACPPISNLAASAMAPRSAPILMVLAMNSSATTTIEQPRRIVPAHIARYAVAGDAADARGDFLDRRHQRKGQQHGPADAVAKLRAGLAVGADPRRIVVGGAGDQSRPERFGKITQAKRPMRLDLRCRPVIAGMLVRVMSGIRILAICHARVQPQRQRTGQV